MGDVQRQDVAPFLGKLLLERSGKSVLQSSAVSAGGLLGLLFALGRLRRKVAVRRLRSAIGGEQEECANVRPFVLRNHIAAFIDLGMLGVQRFILVLETRTTVWIACLLQFLLNRLHPLSVPFPSALLL